MHAKTRSKAEVARSLIGVDPACYTYYSGPSLIRIPLIRNLANPNTEATLVICGFKGHVRSWRMHNKAMGHAFV